MEIKFYDKEKEKPIEFGDLEIGEWFVLADKEYGFNDFDIMRKIEQGSIRHIATGQHFNCIVPYAGTGASMSVFWSDSIQVYRIELKKLTIKVDW